MATSDEDEDTHFCLKCHATIIGLENYVAHRKSKCKRTVEMVPGDEPKPDTLRADDFFSSLNLQSSSKPAPANVPPPTPIKGIVTRSKTGSTKRKAGEGEAGKVKKLSRREGEGGEREKESEEEDWESESETGPETGGKWKPGWNWPQHPPPTHTGGKWRPDNTQQSECGEEEEEYGPPPGHTRGKWGPGGRWPGAGAGSGAEAPSSPLLWCGPCHRRLSSRLLYERHLRSELHFKRTHHESQLEVAQPRRPRSSSNPRQCVVESKAKKEESRRRTRSGPVVCEVCLCRVPSHQMGKHLVSHYHCRHPRQGSHHLVLRYIESIVKQAPFQCQLCKFYCNSVQQFILHWASDMHRLNDNKLEGRFWCSFCKFGTESSLAMGCHLVGDSHREVVAVINHSVPIIIQKRVFLECQVCHRCFRYNAEVRRHAAAWGHVQDKGTASDAYQELCWCPHCPYVGHSLSSMQGHARLKHGARAAYFCRACDKRFSTAAEARRHRSESDHRHRPTTARPCPHCALHFPRLSALKAHITNAHPDIRHRCIKCGLEFVLRQELSQHVKSRSCGLTLPLPATPTPGEGEGEVGGAGTCDKCGFAGKSEAELLFHCVLHGEPQPGPGGDSKFPCPLCHKLLAKESLLNHLRLHTGEKPFLCTLCHLSFSRRDSLSKHQRSAHEQQCECGIQLDSVAQLKRHMDTAHGHAPRTKNHVCSQCGDKFYDRGSLKQHLQRHWGKKFRCEVEECIFSCRSQAELTTHLRTHAADREFNCPNCSYAAKTKGQLAKHVRLQHGDGREYPCPHCSFSTRNSSHLSRHLRLHSAAKPYRCPHCPFACNLLENLRKHVIYSKIHPGQFLYKCRLEGCHFKSNLAKELKSHLVKVHEEDASQAASYVSGLYRPSADTARITSPLEVKPRKRKQKPTATVTDVTAELLKMDRAEVSPFGCEPRLEVNPTLASVALTPCKNQPGGGDGPEPTDDVVFIQETEEEAAGALFPGAGDEEHRRILGLDNIRNRSASFTGSLALIQESFEENKPSTSFPLQPPQDNH